jgi:soluble cytochrome b562
MSNIKEVINSVEVYKLIFEIVSSSKNKYEDISNALKELRKDIDRIHTKLGELETLKIEVSNFKNTINDNLEILRKDFGKKLDNVIKQSKDSKDFSDKLLEKIDSVLKSINNSNLDTINKANSETNKGE